MKGSYDMKKTLGERISEKRKAKGLKQEELAEMLGVSAQAVSKWENDLSCPDIMTLPALSQRLGCTVDELLTGREESPVAQMLPEGERKDFNRLMFRILVDSADGDKVRVNLPLPLFKVLLDSGASLSSININGKGNLDSLNIDWKAIVALVEQGVVGKLVEVESADGDIVEIVVE